MPWENRWEKHFLTHCIRLTWFRYQTKIKQENKGTNQYSSWTQTQTSLPRYQKIGFCNILNEYWILSMWDHAGKAGLTEPSKSCSVAPCITFNHLNKPEKASDKTQRYELNSQETTPRTWLTQTKKGHHKGGCRARENTCKTWIWCMASMENLWRTLRIRHGRRTRLSKVSKWWVDTSAEGWTSYLKCGKCLASGITGETWIRVTVRYSCTALWGPAREDWNSPMCWWAGAATRIPMCCRRF